MLEMCRMLSYTAHFISIHIHGPDIGSSDSATHIKALRFEDGEVFWELRRPLLYILQREVLDLHHLLARELQPWLEESRQRFGELSFVRSQKSANASSEAMPSDRYCQTEALCSSAALLFLCMRLPELRRKRAEHWRARGLMIGILRTIVGDATLEALAAMEGDPDCFALCNEDGQHGICRHVRRLASHLQSLSVAEVATRVVDRLLELVRGRSACPACGDWLALCVEVCGGVLSREVDSRDWCADALREVQHLKGRKRSLRLDPDIKAQVWDAVDAGDALNPESLLIALANVASGGARSWLHQRCKEYLGRLWIEGSPRVLSIACDASRFSNPGEETMAYAAYDLVRRTAAWLPIQVVRDSRYLSKPRGDEVCVADRAKMRLKFHSFMSGTAAPADKDDETRLANLLTLKALDHTLQVGYNIDLNQFRATHLILPLKPSEHRFYLSAADLPKEQVQHGQDRRSCIVDRETGATRLEMVYEVARPHTLHVRSDRGTVGWQMWFYMYTCLMVRGTFFEDEAHHDWTSIRMALNQSGLGTFLYCLVIVLNLSSGPWSGAAFFGQLSDIAKSYLPGAQTTDALFSFFYAGLHVEAELASAWGSEDAMQQALCHLKRCEYWNRKGLRVKLCRWFSVFDVLAQFLPYWHCVAYILTLLCMTKGIFSSMASLVEVTVASLSAMYRTLKINDDPDGGEAAAPRGMRHSDAGVEKMRRKFKGNLHVAASVLCGELNYYLARMMLALVEPWRAEHGQSVKKNYSRSGALQHAVEMSQESWGRTCTRMAESLTSAPMQKIGLPLLLDASVVVDADIFEVVARFAARLVANLLGQRIISGLAYCWSMPYKFASLLSDDAEVRSSTLQDLKRWYTVLQDAERAAITSPVIKDMLFQLVWPKLQWVRCLLVGLDEVEFSRVPQWAHIEIHDAFSGLMSTKVVEDLFHDLRAIENRSQSGVFSRIGRYLGAIQSSAWADAKRPGIPPPEVRQWATTNKINKSAFDAEGGNCSIDEGLLRELTSKKISWRSPSATSYLEIPMVWQSLLKYHSSGWVGIDKVWYSSLLQPCTVVARKAPVYIGGVVVYACITGALLWRLRVRQFGGVRHYQLVSDKAPSSSWKHVVVDTAEGWSAVSVAGTSHLSLPASDDEGERVSPGIYLRPVGDPEPLLRFSCRHGFKGLTVPLLTRLFNDLKVPYQRGSKPTNEAGLMQGLAKFILGDDADVSSVMEARGSTPDELATVLTEEVVGGAADLLDEGEVAEAKAKAQAADLAWAEQQRRRNKAATPSAAAPQRGASSGPEAACSGAASSERAQRRPLPPLSSGCLAYTPGQMRDLLPVKKGVAIHREMKWHHRWKGSYPCDALPKSTSRVFQDAAAEIEAQRHVLRFLWEVHTRETGDACPYEFA